MIGPLSGTRWKALEAKLQLVSLDADYVKLRALDPGAYLQFAGTFAQPELAISG